MMIRYKGFNIFAFSDTHGKHKEVQIPPDTDILICAGDVETDEYNFARFMEWYSNIPALLRLFVPGNHDLSFDIYPIADVQKQIPNLSCSFIRDLALFNSSSKSSRSFAILLKKFSSARNISDAFTPSHCRHKICSTFNLFPMPNQYRVPLYKDGVAFALPRQHNVISPSYSHSTVKKPRASGSQVTISYLHTCCPQ